MTLRNVPNSFTLEQQRLEINELAVDLDTAVDGVQTFTGEKTFTDDITFTDPAGIDFYDGATSIGRLGQQSTNRLELEGSQALHLSANGDIVIKDRTWQTDRAIFRNDGAVELYYPEPYGSVTPGVPGVGTKRFETSGTGVTVIGTLAADGVSLAGDISIGDSDQILFGADNDMTMYHSGIHGFLENGTGDLYLRSGAATAIHIEPAAGADSIIANAGGSVELYYNAGKKFETTSTGVTVSGDVVIDIGTENAILFGSSEEFYIRNTDGSGSGGGINIEGRSGVGLYGGGYLAVRALSDGSSSLLWQSSSKLDTTTTGVSITGTASATEFSGPLTGNADTATALETARTIAGQSFDGTANITIAATDLSDTDQALATTSDVTFNNLTVNGIAGVYGSSTANTSLTVSMDANSTNGLRVDSTVAGTDTAGAINVYHSSGSRTALIQADGSAVFAAASGNTDISIGDTTNTNGRLILTAKTSTVEIHSRSNHPIDFLFNTTTKATLGINGDLSLGGGITLTGQTNGSGATSDTFDHYEEGTWTPVIDRATTAPTVAYNYNTGKYTRIGNVVTIYFDISMTSVGGGSGVFRIGGLPFTSVTDSNSGGYGSPQFRNSDAFTVEMQERPSAYHSGDYINLRYTNSSNGEDDMTVGPGRITGWSVYFVA